MTLLQERISWIDFAKGIAIILVVLGHSIEVGSLQKFIYVFHMPFFFVASGFLLNLDKWGGAENYKPFADKLVRRLLVPYYLAEILWYPFFVAKEEFFGHVLIIIFYKSPLESFLGIFFGKATMLPLSPLWFLPCLLLTEIIFIQIYNRLKNFPKLFVATIFFVTCGGFVLSRLGYLLLGLNVANRRV